MLWWIFEVNHEEQGGVSGIELIGSRGVVRHPWERDDFLEGVHMKAMCVSKAVSTHGSEARAGKWVALFFAIMFLVAGAHVAFAAAPPVVYVSGNGGGGDYTCGSSGAQVQINQALQFVAANPAYTTVHLKGPFTYVINDTVRVGGKTIFEGDSNAVLKLAANCGWPKNKAMIQELNSPSSNIEIRGFKIDGNKAGNPGIKPGAYYHNLIHLRSCSNVKVHNMYLQGSYNDVFKISGGKNIEYYNCILHDNGHDGLYAIKCSGVSAHNNVIGIKCNSGLRFDSCTNCKAYSNRIFSELGGGAGIQVQSDGAQVTGMEFYNNKIYKTATFGFWVFARGTLPAASGTRVRIHDNEIIGVRGSAIKITNFPGVLVENNKISQSGDVDISMPDGASTSSESNEATLPDSSVTPDSSESSDTPAALSCSSESSCSSGSSCSSKKSSCSSGSSGSSDSSGSDVTTGSSESSGSSATTGSSGASDASATTGSSGSSGKVVNVTNTNELVQALANNPGSTIHLKGPATYLINNSLLLSSNTTVEGEAGVVIKIAKGLPQWGYHKCGIAEQKAMFMIKGSSASNVTIRNLTVDGSQSDYYPNITLGWGIFNMATIINCKGLTITNVTWKNGCNDAMLLSHCSDVLVDKVTVNKCGHDGVYAWHVDNITVSNSKFINRTNSSTRFDYVTNGKFFNNDCTTSGGGYAGLELEDTVTNIDVYGNYFHKLAGPAIAHVHTKETNVKIHDNRME